MWPLAPLTRDGATEEAVRVVRDAIEGDPGFNEIRRADHLAVLWFIAEAEDVAIQLLQAYIKKERLMQSQLYKEIFAEGEQRGEQRGEQKTLRLTIADLCEVLGIELTPERRAQLEQLDLSGLHALWTHLKVARTWLPST